MCDQHIANAAFTGRTASRSQAQASRRSSYSMMRPGLAQCDSVLQLRVGPKRRLVFQRPRNGERATLWVDKHMQTST